MLVVMRELAIERWLPIAAIFVMLGVPATRRMSLASRHVMAARLGSSLHHPAMGLEFLQLLRGHLCQPLLQLELLRCV